MAQPATASTDSADFPISWEDPDDAALVWTHDRMHFPGPVSPMEFSLIGAAFEAAFNVMARACEMPFIARVRRINTYYYQTIVPMPLPPEDFAAQYQRALHNLNAVMARLGEIWTGEFLPEITQSLRDWESFDLPGTSAAALAAHWEDTVARLRRVWELHLRITSPALLAMSEFADLYHDLYPNQDPFDAYRLLQGLDNKTLEASRALWQLSRKALASPKVRAALAGSAVADVLAALERSPEGRGFLAEFSAYLEEYGQRGDKWDIQYPSWIEDPSPALKNLKDYITQPDRDLEAEKAALVAERERLVAQTREHLKAYPQPVVDRIELLLKAAQAGTMIIEDHGFYMDYCTRYRVRLVLLELGRRSVASGMLDRPDDVFYLAVDEVREMAQALIDLSPGPSPTRGGEDSPFPKREEGRGVRSLRPIATARRAEMDHFRGISPPPVLGASPSGEIPDEPITRAITKFWGAPPPPTGPAILQGHPGAGGVARGPARVLHSLAEVGRLRPGDVLVAETTAPPWTPLFATVAALVTDTGGVLSHCAIVAREFRIPAVVGTGEATKRIRDGQMLEVDGSAGIVRILSST
jgi:pyruvate,water dikinase